MTSRLVISFPKHLMQEAESAAKSLILVSDYLSGEYEVKVMGVVIFIPIRLYFDPNRPTQIQPTSVLSPLTR